MNDDDRKADRLYRIGLISAGIGVLGYLVSVGAKIWILLHS